MVCRSELREVQERTRAEPSRNQHVDRVGRRRSARRYGPAPVPTNDFGNSQAGTLAGFMDRPPDATILSPWKADIRRRATSRIGSSGVRRRFRKTKRLRRRNCVSNRVVTHHSQVGASPLPRGADPLVSDRHIKMVRSLMLFPYTIRDSTYRCPRQCASGGGSGRSHRQCPRLQLRNAAAVLRTGRRSTQYTPGLVKTIHKEDYMSWNIHYNPTGRPETDRHTLNLWFSR